LGLLVKLDGLKVRKNTMFQSEPICILTAGPTIDGRFVEQSAIDEMAELYNPKTYNARINEEHWSWGAKFGSVLSLEKRGKELWAVLKPNSRLLATIESDQLLHTSCEITPNYSNTGKSYLTGLALTDEPASLGTTAMRLSANKPTNKGKIFLSTGATIDKQMILGDDDEEEELSQTQAKTLLSRLLGVLGGKQQFSAQDEEEDDELDKETKALLTKNAEQNEAINLTLATLVAAVVKLTGGKDDGAPPAAGGNTPPEGDETELTAIEKLTKKFEEQGELIVKLTATADEQQTALSKITDEGDRLPAGGEDDENKWL
jgi:hypothetical protein